MNPLSEYESLSYEERIRRIGAILGKAVTLRVMREQEEKAAAELERLEQASHEGDEDPLPAMPDEALTEEEWLLLRKTALMGNLHPRDAATYFGSARTTTYRRLQKLEQEGWLYRQGKGKASRYHLTIKAHAALKQVKRGGKGQGGGRHLPGG